MLTTMNNPAPQLKKHDIDVNIIKKDFPRRRYQYLLFEIPYIDTKLQKISSLLQNSSPLPPCVSVMKQIVFLYDCNILSFVKGTEKSKTFGFVPGIINAWRNFHENLFNIGNGWHCHENRWTNNRCPCCLHLYFTKQSFKNTSITLYHACNRFKTVPTSGTVS